MIDVKNASDAEQPVDLLRLPDNKDDKKAIKRYRKEIKIHTNNGLNAARDRYSTVDQKISETYFTMKKLKHISAVDQIEIDEKVKTYFTIKKKGKV